MDQGRIGMLNVYACKTSDLNRYPYYDSKYIYTSK